jgi:hypothetical protein
VEATLIAGLAGILGLFLGRFWDTRSEAARWKRDQRIRTYEHVGQAYYSLREANRALALLDPETREAGEAASRVLDLGGKFNSAIVAVWLHGSAPVAKAVREVNQETIKMFIAARARRFSWEEWRAIRGPADHALDDFIGAVRRELSLPPLEVATRIADLPAPPMQPET